MSKEKRRVPAPNPIKALLFPNKNYAPPESFPVYHTMREMLEHNASERPDDVAFQYLRGRKELVSHTYAEFYQTVVYLGTYMLKRGIRGRKIALVGENSYEWLLCYFAIVTTGNVAVLVAQGRHSGGSVYPHLPERSRCGGHVSKVPLRKGAAGTEAGQEQVLLQYAGVR